MSERIHNFSAGPAVMPLDVLKEAQAEMLNFEQSGMSVMEMSHRSKEFLKVIETAEADLRELLNIPSNYAVLFLQGGASLQFSMIPQNLAVKGKSVDAINTGSWTKKGIKEIKRESEVKVIASSEDKNFSYIPKVSTSDFNKDAAFAYITSNNTIAGTQWASFPDTGEVPLVCDMSSDILSRPFDISKFGLVFAGAQKNLGPSGITIVIIRKDLVERAPDTLATMMQYRTHTENESMYNTPPTFAIYMVGKVLKWLKKNGGVSAIEKINQEKANRLYKAIEKSDLYYCPVETSSRSLMNVVFRVKGDNEELEAKFVKEATAAGLSGLKGHRSVGGLRASIYNACPIASVDALVAFMKQFELANARVSAKVSG